mgnify:CR=1 FL=1
MYKIGTHNYYTMYNHIYDNSIYDKNTVYNGLNFFYWFVKTFDIRHAGLPVRKLH